MTHHMSFVQEVLQRVYDAGDIYFGTMADFTASAASASIPKRNYATVNVPIISSNPS